MFFTRHRARVCDCRGASAIEYSLLIALVAVALIPGISTYREHAAAAFDTASKAMTEPRFELAVRPPGGGGGSPTIGGSAGSSTPTTPPISAPATGNPPPIVTTGPGKGTPPPPPLLLTQNDEQDGGGTRGSEWAFNGDNPVDNPEGPVLGMPTISASECSPADCPQLNTSGSGNDDNGAPEAMPIDPNSGSDSGPLQDY